nr:ankyrin repeat domain-containing protein [Stenotrophomonas maltophilia]
MLDRGANIEHACRALGYTALGWAAAHGDTDIGDLLIARGAMLDPASPEQRRTPLMLACAVGTWRWSNACWTAARPWHRWISKGATRWRWPMNAVTRRWWRCCTPPVRRRRLR